MSRREEIADILMTPNQAWKGMKKIPIELMWGLEKREADLIRKAKIEELDSLTYNKQMHGDWQQAIEDRIKSLTQEEK